MANLLPELETSTPNLIDELSEKENESKSFMAKADEALLDVPGMESLTEFASSINKSVAETIDFFGPDAINSIMGLAGSEKRVPRLSDTLEEKLGIGAPIGEAGTKQDVIRAAGNVIPSALAMGGLIRQSAQQLPKIASGAESVMSGILRQGGKSTAAGDVTLGAISGGGGKAGEAVDKDLGGDGAIGSFIGSLLSPIAAATSAPMMKNMLSKGKDGLVGMMTGTVKATQGMSDEGAATLLGEAMVREGMNPDDVAIRMKQLGGEGIPADLGESFSRILRTASNEAPRIGSRSSQVLHGRHRGQSGRIMEGLDESLNTKGLSLDDEIVRMDNLYKPQIKELYAKAMAGDIGETTTRTTTAVGTGAPVTEQIRSKFTKSLESLIENSPSLSKAFRSSQESIKNRQALGERVTPLDEVDAAKKVIDDKIGVSIRQGSNNKAMELVKLKNKMISEVDSAVPDYKIARDTFAGKAQLENAADSGTLFLKLKPRELREMTKGMGESEKRMFKLGAKQAIIDKVEDLQTNADMVKRMFGKNGDVSKLRSLFDTEEAFKQFGATLKREADYIITKNAARGNSTTKQQFADSKNMMETLSVARDALINPAAGAASLSRIIPALRASKGSEQSAKAFEDAGDILLESGMNPDRLRRLLTSGRDTVLIKELQKAMPESFKMIDKLGKVLEPSARAALVAKSQQE